mmetsp:Transcript_36828/g.98055  ORF Transcript_36828/g.98055 Transcript_36828/m.98055 type:complete len:308 (+) Transcript_36828:193-1116(+)
MLASCCASVVALSTDYCPSLSPSSRIRMNSSSVNCKTIAASIWARCLFNTSINFICFLKAATSSDRCLSNFLTSTVRRSVSLRSAFPRSLSWLLLSFKAPLCFSTSSERRLMRASLVLMSEVVFRLCTSSWSRSRRSSAFCASRSRTFASNSAVCLPDFSRLWSLEASTFCNRLFSSTALFNSTFRRSTSTLREVTSSAVLDSSSCKDEILASFMRTVVIRDSANVLSAAGKRGGSEGFGDAARGDDLGDAVLVPRGVETASTSQGPAAAPGSSVDLNGRSCWDAADALVTASDASETACARLASSA